jgi:hypothetical protein
VPSITVTAPDISTVTVHSGSVRFDDLKTEALAIAVENGHASGAISGRNISFDLDSSSARIELTADATAVNLRNSNISLYGTSKTAQLKTRDSSVNAESFRVNTASVDTQNSYVHVNVSGELTVENEDSSTIRNAGDEAGVSKTRE